MGQESSKTRSSTPSLQSVIKPSQHRPASLVRKPRSFLSSSNDGISLTTSHFSVASSFGKKSLHGDRQINSSSFQVSRHKFSQIMTSQLSVANDFFAKMPMRPRQMILDYLFLDLPKLLSISKSWRRSVLEVIEASSFRLTKRFLERYSKIFVDPEIKVKLILLSDSIRVDFLLSAKPLPLLEGKQVLISFKGSSNGNTIYKKFTINIKSRDGFEAMIFQEYSRSGKESSIFVPSTDQSFSLDQCVTIPLTLFAPHEIILPGRFSWGAPIVTPLPSTSQILRSIKENYPHFRWKKVTASNSYLCNLLPLKALQANFKLVEAQYMGSETILLKGTFQAVEEGSIQLFDHSSSRAALCLRVLGKTVSSRHKFVFVAKEDGILKDIHEQASLRIGDTLEFFVKKTILFK